MHGRTVLVTGANSGLGLATSVALAGMGARVLMLCRDAERSAPALEQVAARGRAELVVCDLADPAAIRGAAAEIGRRTERLDVVVHNAGMYVPTRRETPDGLELTFAVNHMGPFRLNAALMPQLQATGTARVVVVSSRSHAEGRLDFDDLQRAARPYHGYAAYSDSKLCNLLFTFELARRLTGTGITANVLHPGVINTGFAQDEPGLLNRLFRVARPFFTSPERGADTQVWLASSPEVEGVTGRYFVKRRLQKPHARALDREAATRLWEMSERLA